jgi:hypothetical protein
MVMQTLVYAGPGPRKSEVDPSAHPIIFSYQGAIYEIQRAELRNIGLEHMIPIVQRALPLGLDPMPEFHRNCLFCDNNSGNAENYFEGRAEVDEAGQPIFNCRFESGLDLKVAGSFTEQKNGREFIAIKRPCAFDDALISYLADSGLLEDYKVDKSFNFRSIEDFEQGKAKPKDFQIKGPSIRARLKYLVGLSC